MQAWWSCPRPARQLWPNGAGVGQQVRLDAQQPASPDARPRPPKRAARMGTFTVVGVVRDPGSASGSSSTRFGACTADEYREPRALAAAHARQRGADATAVVGAPHGHRSDSDQRHQLASARSIADLPAADCLLGLGRFGRTRARADRLGCVQRAVGVVEQQAKEIGVRMALGAATKNVVRLILWQSVRPVGIGSPLAAAWPRLWRSC